MAARRKKITPEGEAEAGLPGIAGTAKGSKPKPATGDSNKTRAMVEAMRAKLGKGPGAAVVEMAQGSVSEVKEYIPCGISVIDHHLLGNGGLPVGRLTELFGDYGTGKSSLCFAFMAGCQRAGGLVGLAETENALQVERAVTFGVDPDGIVLTHPDNLEDVLSNAEAFMKSLPEGVGPNLWVLDSIAACATKAELEAGAGGNLRVGEFARRMSHGIKQLCMLAARTRTALLLTNQTRQKIGVAFGNPTTTPGGESVKFYSSTRLQLMGGSAVKVDEVPVGKDITLMCVKNKLVAPMRKAKARFLYESGWHEPWTTLTYAKGQGVIGPKAQGMKGYQEALAALKWPQPAGVEEVAEDEVEALSEDQAREALFDLGI